MKRVAEGVWQMGGFPPNAIDAYLIGDVLIDAAGRRHGRSYLKQLRGHAVTAHALTHAHPDHQGASDQICETLGIPFWVPEGDVAAAEDPSLIGERQPKHPIAQFMVSFYTGPGRPVDRVLHEGDDVAGFKVIETPGHSAGHVVFWRESDGVLVLGDVLNTADPFTTIRGLREPKPYFTPDPAQNRASLRKLAAMLEPQVICAGHGPVVRDPAAFRRFVDALPA